MKLIQASLIYMKIIIAKDYEKLSRKTADMISTVEKITSRNTIERRAFSVTIDNEEYQRYSGELQIVLKDLPADERVNVAGYIPGDECILVSQINPGTKFRFRKG